MKRINTLFLAIILVYSCTKKSSVNTSTPKVKDIYLAGTGIEGQILEEYARYWKNDTIIKVISNQSEFRAVAASGNDVYIVGHEAGKAKCWKNGVAPSFLSTTMSDAYDVTVTGSDVYVAGFEWNGLISNPNAFYFANYWKNGVSVPLSSIISEARGITVVGSDVYVAGFERKNNSTIGNYAKYWKNGVVVSLSNNISEAKAIAVSGNDVYVVGTEKDNTGKTIATLWKNGVATTLDNTYSEATGIAISGSDVYISGYEYQTSINGPTNTKPKYWKNGIANLLTMPISKTSKAESIYVVDGDVYISGDNGYWKNSNYYDNFVDNRTSSKNINDMCISVK